MDFKLKVIMKKYRKLSKNVNGVSHPLELLFAFSVIIVSFSFIFATVGNMFTSYSKDEFVLGAKSMTISEKLIKDPGKTTLGSTDWEINPNRLDSLGFASYKIINDTWFSSTSIKPDYVVKTDKVYNKSNLLSEIENLTITNYSYFISSRDRPLRIKNVISNKIDYGKLDLDKINALNEVEYETAKDAIGLEEKYDFNIEIIDIDDTELLKYGLSYNSAEFVGSFTRNISIYDSKDASYITARLIVYVF
jgi:hypothetical protein